MASRPRSSPPSSTPATSSRRSPCPVACSLDIFGDRWSLLIVRDLLLGGSRFKDFTASPEGIPTNILTNRLEKLQSHGILTQVPTPEGGKRLVYALTDKGQALRPILRAMRDWALQWEPGTEARLAK